MISQTLKKLALDLKVPVLGVAQLNRNVENRGGEPQLSDLRESGSIEQDADIVMMLHEKKLSTAGKDSKNVIAQHNAEVIKAQENATGSVGEDIKLVDLFIRKNRSGRMGRVPLLFKKNFCRFDSLSEEAERKYNELESESINYLPSE
jgi:replicative DNA helicase